MDKGSLTRTNARSSGWKLAAAIAERTQGLIVSGFATLPTGRALLLNIAQPDSPELGGGTWLRTLARIAPITSAVPPDKTGAPPPATALAFTSSGLERIGMTRSSMASFLTPFREGMFQEDRLRRLGDRRKGEWQETVLPGGPIWSGNTSNKDMSDATVKPYDVDLKVAKDRIETPLTVHAILLLYTADEASAENWTAQVAEALLPHGVTTVRTLALNLEVDPKTGIGREHFGFADGLSQPKPFDVKDSVLRDGIPVKQPDPVQGVSLGEVVLGYINGHQEAAPVPVVPGDNGGAVDRRPGDAGLTLDPQAQGFYDFGLNGSYLVVRELRQDVAAFWRSMDENAAVIRNGDPAHTEHITPEWLAERVVGRSMDGNLLCPGGTYLHPDDQGGPDSDFLFLDRDPNGLGCPMGSHVRRANPRDSLAPFPEHGPTLLASSNNHRILRRGRNFGPTIADRLQDDQADRGLLFMALNTDIARQFEFIQQTWLLNSRFATLFEEVDPLVGPEGRMTIPEDPLRRTARVKTFVKMVGGEYFFLPSLPALRYLAML